MSGRPQLPHSERFASSLFQLTRLSVGGAPVAALLTTAAEVGSSRPRRADAFSRAARARLRTADDVRRVGPSPCYREEADDGVSQSAALAGGPRPVRPGSRPRAGGRREP